MIIDIQTRTARKRDAFGG